MTGSIQVPPCQECGACCVWMVLEPCTADGRCLQLDGDLGVRVRCVDYKRRPYECQDFEPGSPDCLSSLAWLREGAPNLKVDNHGAMDM